MIAENECETDRRLCAEAADGLGSSRARRRNTAFVLPAVCLPVFFVCLHVCLPFCLSACLPACRPVGLFGKCFLKLSDALPLPPKLTSSPQPHPFYLLITSTFSSVSYFDLQATSCGFFCSIPFSHFFYHLTSTSAPAISSSCYLHGTRGLRRLCGPPTSPHLCHFSQPPLSHPLSSGRQ